MDKFIIAQIFGFAGLACSVSAYQCKKHKSVMILKTLNEMLFAFQYFFLGTYTGMAMNIISSARNLTFSYLVKKEKNTLPFQILFCMAFIVSGIFTWKNYLSLIVIFAKLLTTVVYGMKNTKYLRFATVPTSIFWLIYNFSCKATAGVISEIFSLISLISAIIRIDIIGEKNKAGQLITDLLYSFAIFYKIPNKYLKNEIIFS